MDATAASRVHFRYAASYTPREYLIETIGPGVGRFDYDYDGRLDIFVVNGAPLADPTPLGTNPQKTGPKHWNRLYQ